MTMGVDRVERSSRQNATKNSIDKGVAGRSMMAKNVRLLDEVPARQRPALENLCGVERLSRRAGAVVEKAQTKRGRAQCKSGLRAEAPR